MEQTPTSSRSLTANAKLENSPIFGLYYLEEQELDLNEVVGCFGGSSLGGPAEVSATRTCPFDDSDAGNGDIP